MHAMICQGGDTRLVESGSGLSSGFRASHQENKSQRRPDDGGYGKQHGASAKRRFHGPSTDHATDHGKYDDNECSAEAMDSRRGTSGATAG